MSTKVLSIFPLSFLVIVVGSCMWLNSLMQPHHKIYRTVTSPDGKFQAHLVQGAGGATVGEWWAVYVTKSGSKLKHSVLFIDSIGPGIVQLGWISNDHLLVTHDRGQPEKTEVRLGFNKIDVSFRKI